MNKKLYPKPDYKYWAAKDAWSMNKSAFLLHGIDPDAYTQVDLRSQQSPAEFSEVKKTCDILRSIQWKDRYPEYHYANVGVSPIVVLVEVLEKNLRIPAVLKKLLLKRYEKECEKQRKLGVENNESKKEPGLINRERNNYMKSIGLLVTLLIDEKIKSSRNPNLKLSASQIAKLIGEKAEALGLDANGLKSFDRKITEAIELINHEANTEITL